MHYCVTNILFTKNNIIQWLLGYDSSPFYESSHGIKGCTLHSHAQPRRILDRKPNRNTGKINTNAMSCKVNSYSRFRRNEVRGSLVKNEVGSSSMGRRGLAEECSLVMAWIVKMIFDKAQKKKNEQLPGYSAWQPGASRPIGENPNKSHFLLIIAIRQLLPTLFQHEINDFDEIIVWQYLFLIIITKIWNFEGLILAFGAILSCFDLIRQPLCREQCRRSSGLLPTRMFKFCPISRVLSWFGTHSHHKFLSYIQWFSAEICIRKSLPPYNVSQNRNFSRFYTSP